MLASSFKAASHNCEYSHTSAQLHARKEKKLYRTIDGGGRRASKARTRASIERPHVLLSSWRVVPPCGSQTSLKARRTTSASSAPTLVDQNEGPERRSRRNAASSSSRNTDVEEDN